MSACPGTTLWQAEHCAAKIALPSVALGDTSDALAVDMLIAMAIQRIIAFISNSLFGR